MCRYAVICHVFLQIPYYSLRFPAVLWRPKMTYNRYQSNALTACLRLACAGGRVGTFSPERVACLV
jgi:hypothetical protein